MADENDEEEEEEVAEEPGEQTKGGGCGEEMKMRGDMLAWERGRRADRSCCYGRRGG